MRATIIVAEGSTPREVGTAMHVSESKVSGTIGGGALEFDAINVARRWLEAAPEEPWTRNEKEYPLGPRLGQCCGGHVRLLFEYFGDKEIEYLQGQSFADAQFVTRLLETGTPLRSTVENSVGLRNSASGDEFVDSNIRKRIAVYLYGAGHVGREVVRVLSGVAADIVWVDTDESRYPNETPENVKRLVTTEPHRAVAYAPDEAFHLVMTYSHPMDLEICHAVLKRGSFQFLGLIGSATKRARFAKRLAELDVNDQSVKRLICPIGAGGPPSKEPAVIAISVAAEILTLALPADAR